MSRLEIRLYVPLREEEYFSYSCLGDQGISFRLYIIPVSLCLMYETLRNESASFPIFHDIFLVKVWCAVLKTVAIRIPRFENHKNEDSLRRRFFKISFVTLQVAFLSTCSTCIGNAFFVALN